MTRPKFGGHDASLAVKQVTVTGTAVLAINPAITFHIYDAETGGTRVTDLNWPLGTATTVMISDGNGGYSIYLSDEYVGEAWAQQVDGAGASVGTRSQLIPANLNTRLREGVASATGLEQRVTNLEGQSGTAGPRGDMKMVWLFAGNVVAGATSRSFYADYAMTLARSPYMSVIGAPTGAGVEVTLEKNTGAGFVDMFGGGHPSIAAGANVNVPGTQPVPTDASIPVDCRVRAKVITAPVSSAGSLSQIGLATFNADTTNVSSFDANLVITGVADGDLLLLFIADQSPVVSSVPSGWTKVAEVISDATTTHSRLNCYRATYSATLAKTFGLAAASGTQTATASPVVATTFALRGHRTDLPIDVAVTGTSANGSAGTPNGTWTGPAGGNALEANERVYNVFAVRRAAGFDGKTVTLSAGPAGMTEQVDAVTNRGATNTNVGLVIGGAAGPAAAAAIAAAGVSVDTASGTPSGVGINSWTGMVVSVRQGVAGNAATDLLVQATGRAV